MTAIRPGLPPLPPRMRALPVDARGYPVPYFVAWRDGVPDHRFADEGKRARVLASRRCWLCGDQLGRWLVFVIGPMCAINRITSEPPCHRDCAIFAVRACPFLTRPKATRRMSDREGSVAPPGQAIERNPGASALWTTTSFELIPAPQGGELVMMGDPARIEWFAEGRPARRAEIVEAIDSGLPFLLAADPGDEEARVEIAARYSALQAWLPAA